MTLRTQGQFIFVGADSSPYVSNNGPAAGMVRFNTNTQHLEAFDGMVWIQIAKHEHVGMTTDAVEAIQWTRKKIEEEEKLKSLAEKHPGVADAMTQLKKASEQLEIMVQLVNQDKNPVA